MVVVVDGDGDGDAEATARYLRRVRRRGTPPASISPAYNNRAEVGRNLRPVRSVMATASRAAPSWPAPSTTTLASDDLIDRADELIVTAMLLDRYRKAGNDNRPWISAAASWQI